MKTARSLFLVASTLMFAVFAYLQINDATQYGNGDAWAWMALYAIAALLAGLLLRQPLSNSALLLWCGFTAGSLFFKLQDDAGNFHLERLDPTQLWDAENQMVQQTNETYGLLILLIWSAIYLLLNRRASDRRAQH